MTEIKLGTEVYLFGTAIQNWPNESEINEFLCTVIQIHEHMSATVRRRSDQREIFVHLTDIIIPTENMNDDDKTKIHRLARVCGFSQYTLVLLHEGIDENTILDFLEGKGLLAAELRKEGLYQIVQSFVNGQIEWNMLIGSDAVQHKKAAFDAKQSYAKQLREDGSPGSTQPATAKEKVNIQLPELATLEAVKAYAQGLYDYIRSIVIGQDHQLQELVIRLISYIQNPVQPPILLAGPTGCGKTYAIRSLAKKVGMPFHEIALPDLTPAGYVGTNIQSVIYTAIMSAIESSGGYPSRMIVYLDEFDKVTQRGIEFTRQIQNQLLKMLEPEARIRNTSIITALTGKVEDVPFEALVILSGAFSFIESVAESGQIDVHDLIRSGFVPEMAGRLMLTTPFRQLEVTDYEMILTGGACTRLVTEMAECERLGIIVELGTDAKRLIAERAATDKLGARSLNHQIATLFARIKMSMVFGDAPDGIDTHYEDVCDTLGKKKLVVTRQVVEHILNPPTNGRSKTQIGFNR